MAFFVNLNRREQALTRLYWLLVLSGPLTLPEIREATGWSTRQGNNYLCALKRQGYVRLTERGRHHRPHSVYPGWQSGGKWQAITGCAEPGALSA